MDRSVAFPLDVLVLDDDNFGKHGRLSRGHVVLFADRVATIRMTESRMSVPG